jgi:hypothetical protein
MKSLGMKSLALYLGTAIVSCMVFAIIYAPAPLAWRLVESHVKIPDLAIYSIDGSVWEGTAQLQYRAFPVSTLQWSLVPSSLLSLRADLALVATGAGHRLAGSASIGSGVTSMADITGYLHSDYINAMATNHGMQFSGQIDLAGVTVTTDNAWFIAASGELEWTGGLVLLPDPNRGQYALDLPPMSGDLALEGETLTLLVTQQRLPVIDVALARSGWATLGFRARLIELAGLPLAVPAAPDDAVLIVEEKIL